MAEADFTWANLTEPHERLRWARARRYETGELAAEALGMQPNTYRNHEREPGSSRSAQITMEKARTFGRKFRVRWEWLYEGDGRPFLDPADDGEAREIARNAADLPPQDRQRVVDFIEALKRTGTRG